MVRTDPGVAGDAQQSQAHLERYAPADGAKCTVTVGKVTGVFPQKVTDKGFGSIFVARDLQEKVLQLSGDTPNIEDTISPLHSFQVYPNHAQSLSKEEVRWSGVSVNQDLLVFPHPWLFSPAVAQP